MKKKKPELETDRSKVDKKAKKIAALKIIGVCATAAASMALIAGAVTVSAALPVFAATSLGTITILALFVLSMAPASGGMIIAIAPNHCKNSSKQLEKQINILSDGIKSTKNLLGIIESQETITQHANKVKEALEMNKEIPDEDGKRCIDAGLINYADFYDYNHAFSNLEILKNPEEHTSWFIPNANKENVASRENEYQNTMNKHKDNIIISLRPPISPSLR